MVTRVFPGDGNAAPRVPWLKLYSLRMIVFGFVFAGLASRNYAPSLVALGVGSGTLPVTFQEMFWSIGVAFMEYHLSRTKIPHLVGVKNSSITHGLF